MLNKLDDKKVIFFDVGNTLLNFHNAKNERELERLGEKYLYAYLQEKCPAVSEENLKDEFLTPWYKLLEKRKETMVEYAIDELLNDYLNPYGGKLSERECINAVRCYFRPFLEKMEKEKHLYDTLKTLKDFGYQLGIIANTPYYKEVMEECLDEAGIADLFDVMVFSYDQHVAKPKKEIFTYALEQIKCRGEEAIMVGDSLFADMAPASKLGMQCFWLNKKLEDNYLDVENVKEIKNLKDLLDELLVIDDDSDDFETLIETENYDEDDDFDVNDYLYDDEE